MGLSALFGAPGYYANQGGGPPVTIEGQFPTFSAGVLSFTPVATPTDIWQLVGSATKTVRLTRLHIWATDNSAIQTILPINLVKRTTIGTIGSAVQTVVASTIHDLDDVAATAVCNTIGTANYTTVGTVSGTMLRAGLLATWLTPETATDFPTGQGLYWDFGTNNEKCPVIDGVAQMFALNLSGATIVGTLLLHIIATWVENNS